MILFSLHCQMGNQMFQYAFAVAQAKKLKTFFIPFLSTPYYPYKLLYFKTDWFTNFIYTDCWRTKQFKRICRKLIRFYIKETITDEDGAVFVPAQNRTYYEGFFQSDRYFKDNEPAIKRAFAIKKEYKAVFLAKYDSILTTHKILVVHVRRTDYQYVEYDGLGGVDVSLPMRYYHAALSMISNLEQYKIFVVGDDIESVREEFRMYPDVSFESNIAIVDFQLIQYADVVIIANSSFAWWAAYLSQKTDATVYAPNYWLGHKVEKVYPGGIITERFNWVTF